MATADSGHSPEIPNHDDAPTSDEPWNVWTVPNLVSLLRLCGIPLFLWLVLVEEAARQFLREIVLSYEKE